MDELFAMLACGKTFEKLCQYCCSTIGKSVAVKVFQVEMNCFSMFIPRFV